jgi:hypothetical protein
MDGEHLAVSTLHGFTLDLGILAEADITRLMGNPQIGRVQPELSVAIGYAQSSIGGTIGYTGQPSRSALPRTARLGWSASAGLALPVGSTSLKALQADISVQAEHLLVRHGDENAYSYEHILGNLDVIENGLLGRGSADVTARHGVRVAFFETLAVSQGGFDGWGFQHAETGGLEFRLAGPLKILGGLLDNARLSEIADRYDVRFSRSVYFKNESNESTFSGISFVVHR